jgi:hypothetical protein
MRFRILCSIEFQGPLLQKLEFVTVFKFYFWNLWSMVFLSFPHSCITRQYLDLKTSFSSYVIENDVKVNIMPFRTLSSIEFQGSCSRDLNLDQSENCIFGIYDQYSFCRCLTHTSLDLSGEVKSRFFQLSNRKQVKVNIMRFRILCSIEFQGPLLQKLKAFTVWKLYFWNLRSMCFLSMPHSCITRQFVDLKSKFFQFCNRKWREN